MNRLAVGDGLPGLALGSTPATVHQKIVGMIPRRVILTTLHAPSSSPGTIGRSMKVRATKTLTLLVILRVPRVLPSVRTPVVMSLVSLASTNLVIGSVSLVMIRLLVINVSLFPPPCIAPLVSTTLALPLFVMTRPRELRVTSDVMVLYPRSKPFKKLTFIRLERRRCLKMVSPMTPRLGLILGVPFGRCRNGTTPLLASSLFWPR